MDIFSLRCLIEVNRTRHFGRAAQALFISQAQLSKRIRDLEVELGSVLLDRTTRNVELTPAGAEALAESREIVHHVNELEKNVRSVAAGETGSLSLGVVGSATLTILPRLMRILHRDLPGINVGVVAELLTPAQEELLEDHRIDIGLLRLPVRSPRLVWRTVDHDPLVLVVPESHRLAGGTSLVDVRQIRDEPFIAYPADSGSVVRDAVLNQCRVAGFVPNVTIEVSETSTILGLVSSGLGVSLVPQSARGMAPAGTVIRELVDPKEIEIALTWREDNMSPILRRFLNAVEDEGLFLGLGNRHIERT